MAKVREFKQAGQLSGLALKIFGNYLSNWIAIITQVVTSIIQERPQLECFMEFDRDCYERKAVERAKMAAYIALANDDSDDVVLRIFEAGVDGLDSKYIAKARADIEKLLEIRQKAKQAMADSIKESFETAKMPQ